MANETLAPKLMRYLAFSEATLCVLSAPVSVSAMVDDPSREREIRSLEKEIGQLQKRYEKLLKRCTGDNRNRPDARACTNAQVMYQDMQELKRRITALAET